MELNIELNDYCSLTYRFLIAPGEIATRLSYSKDLTLKYDKNDNIVGFEVDDDEFCLGNEVEGIGHTYGITYIGRVNSTGEIFVYLKEQDLI